MRNTKLFLMGAVGLLAAFTATTAYAQTTTTGAIQGVVRDKATGDGLSDVTVVATSPALQGSASELTDGSGQYTITNLPPGLYEVVFYYGEIKIRQANVSVGIGKVTPVTIKMDTEATGGEVYEITQKAPTIDVGSAKQGITIDQNYTKNIPLAGRTFEGTLGAAAGSQNDALGVSFSGSTSIENNYVIDGINTTGLTYGTVGSPLINDFIQETEVITGGYNAEFGRSTGGVVNVVTKSGGNEFHGTVFANLLPLQGDGDAVFVAGSAISTQRTLDYNLDFGFDIGGPIIKDKVWFYVGFAPIINSSTITRIVGTRVDRMVNGHRYDREPDGDGRPETQIGNGADGRRCEFTDTCEDDGQADVDENGIEIFEEVARKRFNSSSTSYVYTGKVNFALDPDNQGQISIIGSPGSGHFVGTLGTPTANQIDTTSNSTDVSAKWNSKFFNNKTEVDVVFGWHSLNVLDTPVVEGTEDVPLTAVLDTTLGKIGRNADARESDRVLAFCTDSTNKSKDPWQVIDNCPVDAYFLNSPGFLTDVQENRYSGKATVTQRITAAGHHQVKGGLDVEDNYLDDFSSLTGGEQYIGHQGGSFWEIDRYAQLNKDLAGQTDSCVTIDEKTGNRIEQPCSYLDKLRRSTNTLNWAGFVQDAWQILPNLTLEGGLRYEEQRMRSADQIQHYKDPLTGRTVGKNALILDGLFAPRVGVRYDWTKEGRSKVYGNWGRFYESVPMDINNRAFGGETLYRAFFTSSQCGDAPMGPSPETTPGIPSLPQNCPRDLNPLPQNSPANTPNINTSLLGGGDDALMIPAGIALIQPGLGAQYLDETLLGIEYELFEDLRIGASFQNRRLGRVIEDLSTDGAKTYIIANPGTEVDTSALRAQRDSLPMTDPKRVALQKRIEAFEKVKDFDEPRRDYNALQLTAFKRFSNHFFLQSSYTYSKLQGNYQGLFSSDNGQVDPNITSQYDLIELLANREGDLPSDRPHNFKFDGYYTFDLKQAGQLTTGVRLRAQSGVPINTLGRHIKYGQRESFILPRGTWGRTDFVTSADLRMQYTRPISKNMTLTVYFDLYNVFDTQTQAAVDAEYTRDDVNPIVGGTKDDLPYLVKQIAGGFEDPDGALAERRLKYANTSARLSPITSRFGLRLEF